jgi:hypothetical protein
MLIRIILSLLLVVGFTGAASATSCTALSQSYFVRCDASGCHEVFSVIEVPAFRTCSRRPVVEEVDKQVGEFIGKIVMGIHTHEARGLYEVRLPVHYWGTPNPNKFERLMEQLEEALPSNASGDRCKVRELSSTEIAGQLKKTDLRDILVQVTKDATVQSADAKRTVFEALAFKEKIQSVLFGGAFWGSSLFALFALVHSVHVYFLRIYRPSPGRSRVTLLVPVGTQLGIGSIGVAAAIVMLDFWPGSFLVPAVALILLCEGWTLLRVSRRAGHTDYE